MNTQAVLYKQFTQQQDYHDILQHMQRFTTERNEATLDEIWQLEHPPVYTQGQAGKPEHLLSTTTIPVVQSDRGGQITYHGPGQLILYFLIDLKRKNIGIRQFINLLEETVIALLNTYGVIASCTPNAPGVYVKGQKICSLGLRVRKGRTYHGISLNIDMDLSPFQNINPCGYAKMKMTQLAHFTVTPCHTTLGKQFIGLLAPKLGYTNIKVLDK